MTDAQAVKYLYYSVFMWLLLVTIIFTYITVYFDAPYWFGLCVGLVAELIATAVYLVTMVILRRLARLF